MNEDGKYRGKYSKQVYAEIHRQVRQYFDFTFLMENGRVSEALALYDKSPDLLEGSDDSYSDLEVKIYSYSRFVAKELGEYKAEEFRKQSLALIKNYREKNRMTDLLLSAWKTLLEKEKKKKKK